ncbi:MAG TPA: YkgJ family cysteine cluster protein [Ferruginibacter sp.]|nr:YkgJ family cysteine cluster protein [Ferruginibacter sp.]
MLRDYLGMVMEQPENAPYVQQVLSMLEGYTNQLKQLKTINRFETVKEVYKAVDGFFDKAPEETKKNIQCKAGCTACCFIDLDISREEAALIVNYCRENDIEIDKEYLTKQVSIGRRPSNGMSRCVFLKDNLCSIYPVRPVSCRKHFVNSDPALCDASKNAVDKVDRYFDINSEILASALLNVDVTEKLEAALLGELEKAAAV